MPTASGSQRLAQHISVTPDIVKFTDVNPGDPVCSAVVQVNNLDQTGPRSIRIRAPTTKWFRLVGATHTERIAPGLAVNFEVTFNPSIITAADISRDGFHDCIKITSEGQEVELWVHALLPRPQLHLEGDLQFGIVGLDSKPTKQLQLINTGQLSADFNIAFDKSLPLTVEPCTGTLQPGSSSSISLQLAAAEVGAIVGELAVSVAGRTEPYRQSINAAVVQQSFELIDASHVGISELNFGSIFFGEAVTRSITVFNNGPAEARFDLSYGSKTDMAAIAATDNDGPSVGDDQHAAFLKMARIRAKLREKKNAIVRVSPIAGSIAPYSTAELTVTFRPLAAAPAVSFKAQPLTAQQQEQLFEYLLQVNLSGGKLLRLPIKGTGLASHLTVTPQVLHFETVPTHEWADQLLELCNTCPELQMHVVFDRTGPYFSVEPAQIDLPPGATASVLARYLPKALGQHEASLSFQVISSKSTGKVLSEVVVQVQGQSLSLGDKQPLPGGVTACPETFTKARAYVDEGEATISCLTAKKAFKRPAMWETADNAYSLQGIGPQDTFGVTQEVLQARKEHADQYTAFIRAGRTAASKRHLTTREGDEADTNLGMKPYRGLSIGRLEQPRQYDPLWTVKQQGVVGPSVQRPSSASVAGIPVHKEWPETNKERADCSRELPPEQLSKVTVGPRQLDFGKVSPAMPAIQHFVVTNPLSTAIHVVLDTSNLEELSCTSPASQVIPAGSTGKFQLSLRCHDVQLLKDKLQYCINGCHIQTVDVVAEVIAVTLELSCEELMFAFSLDNWDNYVEKSLIMENTHTFPVEYEWVMSSQNSVFSVSPASGTIKPKSSCSVVVRWAPGHAAPTEKTKAAVTAADAVATVGRPGSVSRASTKEGGKASHPNASTALDKSKVVIDANVQSNTAVTVNLTGTGGVDAAAVADAASLGCQQTGFMSLKLKGGADAAPKKVMLLGEMPAGLLKIKEKEVNLGPVPVHEQQTVVVQLKNYGNAEASYRVNQHTQLQVSPDRGHVPAESTADLEVLLTPQQPGQFAAVLELEVRGGKPLRLPIRAEGVLPCCHVEEGLLKFSDTFIGASSQLPLTLVNTTPVPATLICDLIQQPEFEIMVGRDAWAGAGYAACPVQKIGANGEVSTVGSKRASIWASRRMTSQGGKPLAAGGSGYRFLIQMRPSSTLPLQLVYRPSRAQPASFPLPMVLHSNGAEVETAKPPIPVPKAAAAGPRSSTPTRTTKPGSASSQGNAAATAAIAAMQTLTLAVPVTAAGVVPKLISSKTTIDFESQVVRNSQQPGKSPYVQEVYARNNTEGVLQVAVGSPCIQGDASGCFGVYAVEGFEASGEFVSLDPGEGFGFTVRFSPKDARVYEANVPVYIDSNMTTPYLQLRLIGTGMLPQLTFNVSECLLPPVPLNVTSRARFFVINGGYDNLELSVRLPPDASRLPISLSFPEGNLIGLAKDRLPVDVSFCSSRAQSFTAMVDFLDEGGRAFSIAVTGATDSCSLMHQPFMQVNAEQLQLVISAEGSNFVKLEDSHAYEMPWDEALGPQHLTEGIVKYLSAVTCRDWGASRRADNSHRAAASAEHSALSGAVENLRQSMRESKGKQLMELVEMLGGKAVSLKGGGSKKSSGNKTETAHQSLAVYNAILTHLRIHGGLVNSVKAEYLLDMDDFDRIMEEQTAAAAGNLEQERLLELWAPVEQSFGSYSAQAWNTVLLQVFRMYILAAITPASLRQLLDTTGANSSANSSKAPVSGLKAAAGTAAKPPDVAHLAGPAGSKSASPNAPKALAGAEAAAAAASGYQIPDDELLASSNIFSVPEACLLTWMSVHMAKAFPQRACQITNFGEDLRDGLVLGALLAAHWPSGSAGALLTRLHQTAEEGRHLRENQEMVAKAMQALCLPYEVTATDIDEADPSSMLILVTYLFKALPQLLPRATLDFTCKLAEQQARDIQLANPTRRVLSYAARLEGSSDFSLEASVVKIDPGRSIQVPVRFTPTTSVTKSCRLVLMSRREGSSASAATLVFLLHGQVDSRAPLKQIVVQAPLYQLGTTEFNVTNPFPTDCDFTINLVQYKPPVAAITDKKIKGSKTSSAGPSSAAAKAASAKQAAEAQLVQQQQAVASLFPEPFGLDRHRIRLRAGASEKLKLSFLPFQLPPLQQSDSAVPGHPPVLKGLSHSLLVLSDSECGEFAYELSGEVLLPGPFLEHKATVGLEGTQSVEVQLPFHNHLLESARRTYADKHPLAKDKEQAAKLRSDIGRTSDKGERLLEYTLTCSNSLLSCPQSLILKAGTPSLLASAAGGRLAPAAGGVSPPPSPLMHHQHPAGDKDKTKADNVLNLQLKPLGTGVYPARLTLTSAYDVRVLDVEVTAQSMGQSCMLEMEGPARQQVLQEVALVNTTDAGFSVTATLTGKGFSGPRDISVPAKTNGVYPLTFYPPGSGTYTGTLELYIAATGERNVYNLVGKGGEPLAEGHLVIECQARNTMAKRLQVPNITGVLPLVYNVYADSEILSGPSTHACSSTNRGDTYKLNILPLRSGTSWGSISFVTEDGQYCWYSIEVKASEPPDMGTIQVSCPVRQAVGIQVMLTNPTDKPLLLRSQYSTPSLVGPTTFVAPPKVPCVFECFYTPLLLQKEQGVLRLVSEEAGEFWWNVHMDATPGGPEHLPRLTAPLGRTAAHTVVIGNPTSAEAHFSCSSSDPTRFPVTPESFTVPPQGSAEVQMEYRPSSLGVEESGRITVTSTTAGSVEYICTGQGEMPSGCEMMCINSALSSATNSSKLCWMNPFDRAATVKVQLSSREPPGTFSLLLPGVGPVVQQQQAQLHRQEGIIGRKTNAYSDAGTATGEGGDSVDGQAARGVRPSTGCVDLGCTEDAQLVATESAECEGGDVDVADGHDPLERGLPAGLPEAMGGLLGSILNRAKSSKGHAKASSYQYQHQQKPQRPQVVLQQVTEVLVLPHAALQLPISFCPAVLREADAELSVSLLSPTVPAPEPLAWQYQVRGLAFMDAKGVKFSVKCKAKNSVEEVLAVPLPGLDPVVVAAIATAAGQGDGAPADLNFSHEIIIADEDRAALATAGSVQQLDRLPVNGGNPMASQPAVGAAAAAAADCPPVLRYRVGFAPQKALSATMQLAVACSSGARWVYVVKLTSTAPEVEGVLNLEAHMGCTAELPLMMYSSGPKAQPFTAEFTPDTPLNFDVVPASGLLPPGPRDGVAASTAAAPMKVTFLCKEMGKVITGRLVVVTPDSQSTFIVRGRQPAYVPPSREKLPSGTYLTAGTASTTARLSSSQAGRSTSPLQPARGRTASTPHFTSSLAGASMAGAAATNRAGTGRNYLQQNIRAAKSVHRNPAGSGDGGKTNPAARPWS